MDWLVELTLGLWEQITGNPVAAIPLLWLAGISVVLLIVALRPEPTEAQTSRAASAEREPSQVTSQRDHDAAVRAGYEHFVD